MANDGLMYRADMKFCDNIITDNQNTKKELEEIKKPLLIALNNINKQIKAIDRTIDKYTEKRKKIENDYLRYSETSSISSS